MKGQLKFSSSCIYQPFIHPFINPAHEGQLNNSFTSTLNRSVNNADQLCTLADTL